MCVSRWTSYSARSLVLSQFSFPWSALTWVGDFSLFSFTNDGNLACSSRQCASNSTSVLKILLHYPHFILVVTQLSSSSSSSIVSSTERSIRNRSSIMGIWDLLWMDFTWAPNRDLFMKNSSYWLHEGLLIALYRTLLVGLVTAFRFPERAASTPLLKSSMFFKFWASLA